MANFTRMGVKERWIGASTDTKPTTAPPGSTCYEYDTGLTYVTADGSTWVVQRSDNARSATLVVAASNASALEKAQADYVCDGIADNVEIAAAIAALPATGGTVQLSSGTFNIAAKIAITGDHIRIKGQGSSEYGFYVARGYGVTTLLAASDLDVIEFKGASYANMMIGSSISGVLIRGFSKAGGKAGLRLEFVDVFKIDDIQCEGNGYGMSIVSSFAIRATRSLAILNDIGILLASNDATACAHNQFTQVDASHNDKQGYLIQSDGTNHTTTRNLFGTCQAHDNGKGLSEGKGFSLVKSDRNVFSNCIASEDDTHDGFGLDRSNFNTFTGCSSEQNAGHGFQVYGSSDNIFNGCMVLWNDLANTATYDGIHVVDGGGATSDRNIITNNRCDENDRYEIHIESGMDNVVKNNTVKGSDHQGTIVNTGTSTAISGNKGFIAPGEERTKQVSLVATGTKLTNATGTLTESGVYLLPGVNTLNITGAGTFTVTLPAGTTGTVASGTATLVGSPITLSNNLVIDSGVTTGTITVTLTCIAAAIPNPEAEACLIKRLVVDETTPGGTATSVLQGGLADDSAGLNIGSELFTGADANAAAILDSWLAGDTGAQSKYLAWPASGADSVICLKTNTEKADALVGKVTVYYVGR